MDINELAKEYYQILDSYDPTGVWINETTVEDCKGDIENYPYLVIEKLVNIIKEGGGMMTDQVKRVKNPCRGCVYFKACGENTRTAVCNGRQTKTDKKKAEKKG